MAENGPFAAPFDPIWPQESPCENLCGSPFCVLSQEMRHINIFLGAEDGVFRVGGGGSWCWNILCAFLVPYFSRWEPHGLLPGFSGKSPEKNSTIFFMWVSILNGGGGIWISRRCSWTIYIAICLNHFVLILGWYSGYMLEDKYWFCLQTDASMRALWSGRHWFLFLPTLLAPPPPTPIFLFSSRGSTSCPSLHTSTTAPSGNSQAIM